MKKRLNHLLGIAFVTTFLMIGAFAWSLTPDPKPSNNYGEDTVTP